MNRSERETDSLNLFTIFRLNIEQHLTFNPPRSLTSLNNLWDLSVTSIVDLILVTSFMNVPERDLINRQIRYSILGNRDPTEIDFYFYW